MKSKSSGRQTLYEAHTKSICKLINTASDLNKACRQVQFGFCKKIRGKIDNSLIRGDNTYVLVKM